MNKYKIGSLILIGFASLIIMGTLINTDGDFNEFNDGNLRISAITMISPNSSTVVDVVNSPSLYIEWTSTNPVVYIHLAKDSVFYTILSFNDGKSLPGSGSWTEDLPSDLAPGTDYQISIIYYSDNARTYITILNSNYMLPPPPPSVDKVMASIGVIAGFVIGSVAIISFGVIKTKTVLEEIRKEYGITKKTKFKS